MGGQQQLKRCPGGCRTSIPAHVLVCPECWLRLPEALRTAVTSTQHDRRLVPTDPVAVAEHRAAAADARSWLRMHPSPRPRLVTADLSVEVESSIVSGAGKWERCKACQAPIVWATTSNGDKVPVDVESVDASTGSANIKLTPRGDGRPPRAERVRDQSRFFGASRGWRDHMTTCPYAEHYRVRAARRRAS